jgi:predicted acylesterase/phospholipase RssA
LPLHYFTNDLSMHHQYIIFIADPRARRWTKLALNQSDCIVMLDSAGRPPDPSLDRYYRPDLTQRASSIHLVVLHSSAGLERHAYLDDRPVAHVHNILTGTRDQMSRLARVVTGNGIALALGGGSCRGLAHCGVIKALKEEGIPLDIVGGTSAGSLVAALVAMGHSLDDISLLFTKLFQITEWLRDFTLPYMSLLSAKALHRKMHRLFGSRDMRELSLPMFAVACNMSTYKAHIFRSGPLWLALRASISLPPFLPPVRTPQGVMVDGGFVMKVPVEACGDFGAKHIIGVDVSHRASFGDSLPDAYVDRQSGKRILAHKFFVKHDAYLSIMEIMTELGYLIDYNRSPDRSCALFIRPPDMVKYGTFTTEEEAPEIIEKGYVEAKAALKTLKAEQPDVYAQLCIGERLSPEHPSIRMRLLPAEHPGGGHRRVTHAPDGSVRTPGKGVSSILVAVLAYVIWRKRGQIVDAIQRTVSLTAAPIAHLIRLLIPRRILHALYAWFTWLITSRAAVEERG